MIDVQLTADFSDWLAGLRDRTVRARLLWRLERVGRGALGDVNSVGEGVMEMREHFGAGWRMYYVQRGDALIVMLGGGGKDSQMRDIAAAKKLAERLEE